MKRVQDEYARLGLAIFAAGAALILLYRIIDHFEWVRESLNAVAGILSPFIFGMVMAYLLCPVYNTVVRRMYHLLKDGFQKKKTALRVARIMGSVLSLMALFGVVGGLFALVLPETIRSILGLAQMLPDRLTDLIEWGEKTLTAERYPEMAEAAELLIRHFSDNFSEWTENDLMPRIGEYMAQISMGVYVTLRTLFNLLIGVIVCVYLLNSKELFKAQIKKVISATMTKDKSDDIFEFAYFANRTFGGFINGKLIDSLIIGILCFILMSIFKFPYTVLVSTIVGVTNFIPFFGPFIGAVPSALIICLASPIKALYFLILVFALQQFDGNILGPKILGGTTGLSSFWVMFAIIVGGGFFGFTGMVLGVPVFAVLYYYFSRYIKRRLARKQMPTETADYTEFNKYDIDRKDVL